MVCETLHRRDRLTRYSIVLEWEREYLMRENLPSRYQSSGPPVNPDATSAVEYVLSPETEEPRFRDYWKMVVKRRRLIILTSLVVFGFGAFITFRTTPLYTANTILLIEPQNLPATGLGEGSSRGEDYFMTQLALLKSRALAARVITDLGLERNPNLSAPPQLL